MKIDIIKGTTGTAKRRIPLSTTRGIIKHPISEQGKGPKDEFLKFNKAVKIKQTKPISKKIEISTL